MPNLEGLLIAAWAYVILSVCVIAYWMFEVYRTAIARAVAPLLRDKLVEQTCPSCKGRGREALGYLLNQLDNAVRDHPQVSTQELDRFVVALAVAHLLREDGSDLPMLEERLSHFGSDRLTRAKSHEKSIISPEALGAYLGPGRVSNLQLRCLALRLRQNWREILELHPKEKTQPA